MVFVNGHSQGSRDAQGRLQMMECPNSHVELSTEEIRQCQTLAKCQKAVVAERFRQEHEKLARM